MSVVRHRDWFITIWPSSEDSELWSSDQIVGTDLFPFDDVRMTYLAYVIEVSKDNKVHAHVAVHYKNPRRLLSVKNDFPGAKRGHLQPWFSKPADVRAYIFKGTKKGNTPLWCDEFGKLPAQGERTDWEDAQSIFINGGTMRDVLVAHPELSRYPGGLRLNSSVFTSLGTVPPELESVVMDNPKLAEAVNLLIGPFVPRRWVWVWSRTYGVGKSALGTFLALRFNALPCTFDLRSCLFAYERHPIVYWDIPRESTLLPEWFHIWEEMSDGKVILSAKYESAPKFVRANVLILSNHPPPLVKYGDRVVEINLD